MDSREKLLDAARQCLLELGHGASTIKAIALRAGVNHGLVHHYFGSKENLMVEVITRETQMMLSRVSSAPAAEMLDVIVQEMVVSPERPRLLVEFLSMASKMPQVAKRIQITLEKRDAMFRDKLGMGDAGLRWLLASALLGLALTRDIASDVPTEKIIDRVRQMILNSKGTV